MVDPRVVIIGAGPTGLGAGHRLRELGHDDWVILESSDGVGGLARSFTDEAGFTYDIGTHVLFSHYPYFSRLIQQLIGDEYTELRRETWIWMEGRFVPYPLQNHVGTLQPQTVLECVLGLIEAQREQRNPTTFREWVEAVFGTGIAKHFMLPYNEKVWATSPDLMTFDWIGERVSVVDLETVLRSVVFGDERRDWGPNQVFQYPLRGGIGNLYERLGAGIQARIELRCPVTGVDPIGKVVTTADGRRWPYDALLSTMPIDDLVTRIENVPDSVRGAGRTLLFSGIHVVGVGLDRPTETSKTWVYYPQPEVPFQRVTYLSNSSPYMTPRRGQTLLLTETSTSGCKPEDAATIVSRVTDGLLQVGLMRPDDRVLTTWRRSVTKAYPVPSLGRDDALRVIEPWLTAQGVASRGRFGAWRYEIGNMDHSCMQGVEWVDNLLSGAPETVWSPV